MTALDVLDVRASEVIERYSLIGDEPILVAVSGGKDSLLLGMALQRLGIACHFVAIDMGFSARWGERIRKLGAQVGLEVDVVDANGMRPAAWSDNAEDRLTRSMVHLTEIEKGDMPDATPCTFCYNAKATLLYSAAAANRTNWIAFGHHGTDALASFFKSALMYVDRWENGNRVFSKPRFRSLVHTWLEEMQQEKGLERVLKALKNFSAAGKAGTDEPPLSWVEGHSRLRIVRPFFGVYEHQLIDARDFVGLETESSGCGHGSTLASRTPREIVQFELLEPLCTSSLGITSIARVMDVIEGSLREDGSVKADVRRNRAELLGRDYKPNSTPKF